MQQNQVLFIFNAQILDLFGLAYLNLGWKQTAQTKQYSRIAEESEKLKSYLLLAPEN